MAIWQYSFLVIPRTLSNERLDKDHTEILSNNDFDDEYCWLETPTKVEFFEGVGEFLTKNKSWSDSITLYGEQESNRFEVYKNEYDLVCSVSFRIDFTSSYEYILRMILEFVQKNRLQILDEELLMLDNNFEEVKAVIEDSPQYYKYCQLRQK